MSKFTTRLSDDRQTFILRGNIWFNEYPVSQLDGWLSFYRDMKATHPKSGNSYDPAIKALEELQASLTTGA